MFDPTRPFALLWDADAECARLFTDMRGIVADWNGLRQPDDWLAGGIGYEAGHALEPRLAGLAKQRAPFWFGRFGPPRMLDRAGLSELFEPFRRPAAVGEVEPLVSRAEWEAAVGRVLGYIAAGDIYQANLTFPARVPLRGHPLALFAHLFTPEAAPHGGVVHMGGGQWWLSLSPELFFTLDGRQLTARPMKGTAARGIGQGADMAAAEALALDTKNRAENLMITDLLRNDLSRVAEAGSVKVPHLFAVETYPSVHQLTSTVTARLSPGRDAADVLQALFPCGSITGAPKLRAMEIIAEQETSPRGIYCGSIGFIEPGGRSARMNVAIRTLEVAGGKARLGLGAGIVADSVPADEWQECLQKSRFLKPSAPRTLIETMRLEPDGQVPRMALHLERLQNSARRFGFRFDRPALEARLQFEAGPARRLRLLLSANGTVAIQLSQLPPNPDAPVDVGIVPLPVGAKDWRLAHKSGDRAFHEAARQAAGTFEVVYERPDGLLTEGSYTSLFVERDGRLLTPPLALGLLPGVLRAEYLASGRCIEAELRREDLEDGFLLGNSLRGLFQARPAQNGARR